MKGRVIALGEPSDRSGRAALIVDGILQDLLIDPDAGSIPYPGQIYAAVVDRPVPNLGATFARLPGDLMTYVRDAGQVSAGARIIVQITGFPEPDKAFPATTEYLLKSRTVILTPGRPGVNVSRAIKDTDLKERLAVLGQQCLATFEHDGGLILRTEAATADIGEIEEAIRLLVEDDGAVLDNLANEDGPALLLNDPAGQRARREWMTSGTEIATLETLGTDPFEHFGVWDEVERLTSPRVDLPSGGWMAVEATRAMVTVDVNTGDQFGGGAAMTANIEAARELPRQLRLRGLGGQVVIDCAPIKKMHRKKIEETLKSAFRRDPIATTLAGWTPLGNFELQ